MSSAGNDVAVPSVMALGGGLWSTKARLSSIPQAMYVVYTTARETVMTTVTTTVTATVMATVTTMCNDDSTDVRWFFFVTKMMGQLQKEG